MDSENHKSGMVEDNIISKRLFYTYLGIIASSKQPLDRASRCFSPLQLSSLSKPKGKKGIVENKMIVFTVQKIFFD